MFCCHFSKIANVAAKWQQKWGISSHFLTSFYMLSNLIGLDQFTMISALKNLTFSIIRNT